MNVEQVCAAAVNAQLFRQEQVDQLRQAWLGRDGAANDGAGFVQSLVGEHQLTDFQAAALLAGIPGPYMLGPYRVSARLTAGRLGDVFKAEHVEFKQPVALKIFPATLSRNAERLARLGREARVGLQADHMNVVKTFQVGKVGEIPFIALEELSGESLEQRLERAGRLPYAEACELIQQAARGLGYLHSEGIIHRDICPANLWITTHGLVKILEFGAARDALSFLDSLEGDEDELTVNGLGQSGSSVLGHYDYMSSEQAQDPHSANVASDLYSLGCTLYRCLTGQVPFPDRNPVRQMLRHANEVPKPLFDFDQEIPESVQEIVSKLLAKQPSDRFDSAEEVAERLSEVVPPKTLPELDPVNAEFLEWLRTGHTAAENELQDVGYEPEFQEFLDFVSESRFDAVMSQRPTF